MIEFHFDPNAITDYIEMVEEKGVDLSTRYAVNRALRVARKITDADLEKRYGISKSGRHNIDDYLISKKLRLKDVREEKSVFIWAAHREKQSLIHYVLGSKQPQNLKGVPRSKRRRLYVKLATIGPHPHSFIQEPRLGKYRKSGLRGGPQVFSFGWYKGTRRLFRQTISDAYTVMNKDEVREHVESEAFKEMERSFYMRLEKELQKLNREPLTMGEQKARGRKF